MWIAGGSYPGPMTLTAADDGFTIVGNYNSTAAGTTITGTPEGLLATNATGITIDSVTFVGQAPAGPSSSAYGVVALSGSTLTLTNSIVRAGNGTNGAAGSPGGAGTSGQPGGTGGGGETPAEVAARCLQRSKSCSAIDGSGGTPGLGANGNDFYIRDNGAYKANPLLDALALSLPLPGPGPSAGDGGFGGWGNTASGFTAQGCVGKGSVEACGPEKVVHGKHEVMGSYYGGWGSQPYNAPAVYEGSGGAPGYANSAGDGHPGTNGTGGASGANGDNGGSGPSSSPSGATWTPGDGSDGNPGNPGAGGGGGGGAGGDVEIRRGQRDRRLG